MPLTDEQIIRSIGEDLPVGIWVARAPRGEFVYELYPEDRMPFMLALRSGTTVTVDDIVIHRTDGGRVHIRAQARPVRLESGEISHVVIAFIDISREVEAESRLRLMQRMESIGTLAGGIAHDFNNLLSVVKIVASTLASQEEEREKLEGLASIEQAADSETELCAVGEVKGDQSQLEQVVMNLVVNARDAMPAGGLIALRTRDEAGSVVLEVADTGSGIPLALRERVFEPYFTTKAGLGTGLGLATVFGIVASHGGSIELLDNQPRGTLMRVRLAAAPGASPAPALAPAPGQRHDPARRRRVARARGDRARPAHAGLRHDLRRLWRRGGGDPAPEPRAHRRGGARSDHAGHGRRRDLPRAPAARACGARAAHDGVREQRGGAAAARSGRAGVRAQAVRSGDAVGGAAEDLVGAVSRRFIPCSTERRWKSASTLAKQRLLRVSRSSSTHGGTTR
jgi:signal transduction histidine kinase